MARLIGSDVILADLDMAFGTAGLDFNLDPPQGIAEAVFGADRLDEVLLDRLLAKCEDHLSLLAAPAALDKAYDFGEDGVRADAGDRPGERADRRARRSASCGRPGCARR